MPGSARGRETNRRVAAAVAVAVVVAAAAGSGPLTALPDSPASGRGDEAHNGGCGACKGPRSGVYHVKTASNRKLGSVYDFQRAESVITLLVGSSRSPRPDNVRRFERHARCRCREPGFGGLARCQLWTPGSCF